MMKIKNKLFEFSVYKDKEEQKFIVHWWWNVSIYQSDTLDGFAHALDHR